MKDICIGIIEDQVILKDTLARSLERYNNIQVNSTWETAEEAIDSLSREETDLVIIDKVLPGMDGINASREIQKISPGTKTILLSMHIDGIDVVNAFEAGITGILPKDISVDQLVDAIRCVARGEVVLNDRIVKNFQGFKTEEKTQADECPLSPQQLDILRLAGSGWSNKEIARHLGCSVSLVKLRFHEVFQTLEARDRTHAVIQAVKLGYINTCRFE